MLLKRLLHTAVCIAAGLCPALATDVALPDTAAADSTATPLHELVVRATRPPFEVIPMQRLDGKQLRSLNSQSVADALRYFAGVQIKDYGGVGGIKTANIRSMGTNHTGVVYDGVELGNAQNGQVDLGQLSLDNVEAISLYNGQKSEILQPARDFGSAATVYIRTRTPEFMPGERYHVRGTFRTGSFDLVNPSVLVEVRLSERVNAQAGIEWTKSSGRYKFRYRRKGPDGQTAYDTTATRHNGDINAIRAEVNLNGDFTRGYWRAKVYHYNSDRGIPGAIVSNVWRRGERVTDNNTFVQSSLQWSRERFTTLVNAKFSFYKTRYINRDEKVQAIDNRYWQKELYLSTANEYTILPQWRISASYDFMWNAMNADLPRFVSPHRFTHMAAAATALNLNRFKAQASAMGTFIHDVLHGRPSPADKTAFTPAIYLSGHPLRNRDFSARFFAKRSFRMPTFNDLYYADAGNSRLSPERVTQYNLGFLYDHTGTGIIAAARVGIDTYINRVKDKIVAYPKGQQFRWTMLNLGKVDIKGIDVNALLTLRPVNDLYLTARLQYTWQRAIDVTNPSDSYYRDQIPYIPRHSGTAVVNASWRGWTLNLSRIYVGARYNQQENIAYNYTPSWTTTDLSLGYNFTLHAIRLRLLAEVNNLLNQDYDVIINYPMPRRNYRFTLTVEI